MQIEMRDIAALRPSPHNARVHGAQQVRQLAESIRKFGFNSPVLVDAQGVIIAGHGRVEAAKQAGLTQVPVVALDHLTPDQVRAFMLADNRIALNSAWDEDALRRELEGLEAHFADFGDLGFDAGELDRLFGEFVGEPGTSVLDGHAAPLLSEDAEAADSAPQSAPASAAPAQAAPEPIRIPIFINLSPGQQSRWNAMKKEMGEPDNTKAFIMLAGLAAEEAA